MEQWTIDDVWAAHQVLDMYQRLDAMASARARQQQGSK